MMFVLGTLFGAGCMLVAFGVAGRLYGRTSAQARSGGATLVDKVLFGDERGEVIEPKQNINDLFDDFIDDKEYAKKMGGLQK